MPGQPPYLAVAVPEPDLLVEARQQRWPMFLSTLLVPLSILVLQKLAGRLSRDLKRLAADASAMGGFPFEAGPRLRSLAWECAPWFGR